LAALRQWRSVQVRRFDVRVGSSLVAGDSRSRKISGGGARPKLGSFNECTRGELAIPLCARTTDPHFGTNGIGDASTEDPLGRWRNLRKGDHLLPDLFRWGLNVDCGVNNKSGGLRWGDCVKKTRKRHAVRKMKVGPSEPPCRRRLQTALSCFGPKGRGGER
jgi:hypothetical protein